MAAIPGLGGGVPQDLNITGRHGVTFRCSDEMRASAFLLTSLGVLGISANILLMVTICFRRSFKSWSYGLLFHQGLVDLARSALLIPLGQSIYACRPMTKCSLIETTFLLLVTVSTVNLLSVVLNAAPIIPEEDDEDVTNLMKDNPQCMAFGLFMIWFASVTVNLGPTFLSGALAANADTVMEEPSCPLVQGPYRHYVLNAIWIFINSLSIMLTIYHLHKLYKDSTQTSLDTMRINRLYSANGGPGSQERLYSANGGSSSLQRSYSANGGSGSQEQLYSANGGPVSRERLYSANGRPGSQDIIVISPSKGLKVARQMMILEEEGINQVKMFVIITLAYLIFWGPLFVVTLANISVDWKEVKSSVSHEVSLHVSFVHAIINPLLFLLLHKDLRASFIDMICCQLTNYQEKEEMAPDTTKLLL